MVYVVHSITIISFISEIASCPIKILSLKGFTPKIELDSVILGNMYIYYKP